MLTPDEAATILRDMIDAALAGDPEARRLCFERLAPRRRDAPLTFDLPDIATPEDAIEAANAIPALIADGVCQRRSKNASVRRSKSASLLMAVRPPEGGLTA